MCHVGVVLEAMSNLTHFLAVASCGRVTWEGQGAEPLFSVNGLRMGLVLTIIWSCN